MKSEAAGRQPIQDRTTVIKKGMYSEVKRMHKSKGFPLDNLISFEDYSMLVNQECYYCGAVGTQKKRDRNSDYVIYVNRINRLDSSLGFTKENCVSSCTECSSAKLSMSEEEFAAWDNRAYNKLVLNKDCSTWDNLLRPLELRKGDFKGKYRRVERSKSILNTAYQKLLSDARRHNREFSIDKKKYEELIVQECSYCGLKFSRIALENDVPFLYLNTLDRVDSRKGYTLENVKPCCFHCNIAKGNKSMHEFLELIKRLHPYSKRILSRIKDEVKFEMEPNNEEIYISKQAEEELLNLVKTDERTSTVEISKILTASEKNNSLN